MTELRGFPDISARSGAFFNGYDTSVISIGDCTASATGCLGYAHTSVISIGDSTASATGCLGYAHTSVISIEEGPGSGRNVWRSSQVSHWLV